MIKKIVSKWFGFEKELKAKDMKIHLREGELESADIRLRDLETELVATNADVKNLEQKIIALKKDLQTETALKNEAIQVATDQKNTIEQLRTELSKLKKTKSTKKK